MGHRILLVDDDADTRDVVAITLRGMGYETRGAARGSEAIGIAIEWEPRVVLLDLGLPGMDGYEVASALREIKKGRLKIIAFSGSDPSDPRFEALFDGHVLKPLGLELLERKLEEAIGGK
jgi:CheY-like chemotaxis protein